MKAVVIDRKTLKVFVKIILFVVLLLITVMVAYAEEISFEYDVVEEEVPYETDYVYSDELYSGVEATISLGSVGRLVTTYESTYINGELADRSEYSVDLQDPENEVVAIGSKDIIYPDEAEVTVDPETKTLTASDGETFTYSKIIEMTATAYTYSSSGRNITASGAPVAVGIVAALPSTLPLGSMVYIVSPSGEWEYGIAVVGDIPGSDILDLFMETRSECLAFGYQDALVYIIEQ